MGLEKHTVWDPLRKKEVVLTPEEEVRQWFIGVLRDEMGVPAHLMRSEVPLTFDNGKRWRADIVVYGRNGLPLLVVECKRPEEPLSEAVADQALRYNNVLEVKYMVLTNGHGTYVFRRGADNAFETVRSLPQWEEMNA